jgi:hypothetical protein
MKPLLIVGIDPGTTAGYAAIDVRGAIVAAKAAKEFSADAMIAELRSLGSVFLVGTDKAKAPAFVDTVATQLGAKISVPAEDLRVAEKRALTEKFPHANSHEMDALAAAVMAFRKHERLFSRIECFLAEKKNPAFADAMKEMVVRQGISIRAAFDFLTAPEKKEAQIVRRAETGRTLSKEDYWRLYDAFAVAQGEKELLQRQNRKLANLAKRLKRKNSLLRERVKPETRVIRPTGELEQARNTINELRHRLEQTLVRQQRLHGILLHPEKYVIAKRLASLGYDEYRRAERVLGFRKGDVLFVEDINSCSSRALDELAGLIDLAVSVKPALPKTAGQLPFTVLSASEIPHTQDEYFVFLDRPAVQKARADRELLRKLIADYRQDG